MLFLVQTSAIVSVCTLYVSGIITSNAPQTLTYYEFMIKGFPHSEISSFPDAQWTAIDNATVLSTQQLPRSLSPYNDAPIIFNSGSTFVNYIQNCISNRNLDLSIRGSDEDWSNGTTIHDMDFHTSSHTTNGSIRRSDFIIFSFLKGRFFK
jgi:hypothetical protein